MEFSPVSETAFLSRPFGCMGLFYDFVFSAPFDGLQDASGRVRSVFDEQRAIMGARTLGSWNTASIQNLFSLCSSTTKYVSLDIWVVSSFGNCRETTDRERILILRKCWGQHEQFDFARMQGYWLSTSNAGPV